MSTKIISNNRTIYFYHCYVWRLLYLKISHAKLCIYYNYFIYSYVHVFLYNDVYFTSPHWNPAVEDQAVARVHRLGQTKPVNVYHFISTFDNRSWTIDQLSLDIQRIKRERMAELKENSANNNTI